MNNGQLQKQLCGEKYGMQKAKKKQEKKRREKIRLLRDETETGGPADSAGHAMNGGKDG